MKFFNNSTPFSTFCMKISLIMSDKYATACQYSATCCCLVSFISISSWKRKNKTLLQDKVRNFSIFYHHFLHLKWHSAFSLFSHHQPHLHHTDGFLYHSSDEKKWLYCHCRAEGRGGDFEDRRWIETNWREPMINGKFNVTMTWKFCFIPLRFNWVTSTYF